MKKKFSAVLLAAVSAFLFFGAMACDRGGEIVYGRYYRFENGQYDETDWIELKINGTWTASEDPGAEVTLTYTLQKENITLTINVEELSLSASVTGTVKNGVLTITIEEEEGETTMTYRKKGTSVGTLSESSVAGRYYLYVDGQYDETEWIELKSDGTWAQYPDGSGDRKVTCTYTVKNGKITLTSSAVGMKVELSGTVKNGVLTIAVGSGTDRVTIIYRRK